MHTLVAPCAGSTSPRKMETLKEGETIVPSFLGKLRKLMNEEVLKVMK